MSSQEGTKSAITAAARELLLQHGLAGFSMRKVGRACGLSAPAIYRHYADKDALIAAAVVEGFRTFESYLMAGLEEPTLEKRMRMVARRYFDFALEHSADYRLIFMTDCEPRRLLTPDEASKREMASSFQLLQDLVQECQVAGLYRAGDPRAIAASIWSAVHGLASLILTGNLGRDEGDLTSLIELHLLHINAGVRL